MQEIRERGGVIHIPRLANFDMRGGSSKSHINVNQGLETADTSVHGMVRNGLASYESM